MKEEERERHRVLANSLFTVFFFVLGFFVLRVAEGGDGNRNGYFFFIEFQNSKIIAINSKLAHLAH